MSLWTARQIWATLPKERRLAASLALWEDENLPRASRLAAMMPWLMARGMRAEFLEKLPRPRRAALMADGGMPEETASQALMSFHLRHQRPLLGKFLDQLGIRHENGLIKEEQQPEPPTDEKIAAAVEAIRGEFPAEDVALYLRTLTATDPDTWAAVGAFAGDPQA